MPDIQIPDLIKSASNAAQDNLPATMKQTDGALSTVVGFFNNVVLYPVKKANLTFRYKLEDFENDLKQRTKHIPVENLQVPPTMIVGPTLEALRYTYDEAELREMYENLLASSMDNRIASQAHPSFVDAIRQMSPIDAQIINKLTDIGNNLRCFEITFRLKDLTNIYSNAMPNYFVEELYDIADPFIISTSLINLQRLGIIRITESGLISGDYDSIKKHPYVLERESLYRSSGKYDFDISIGKRALLMNNYGKQFAKICLRKENQNAN